MSQDLDRLLKEKFTNNLRKGYVTIEGYTFPLKYSSLKESFDKFDVSEDDIWVCSFPKCGTTWTQEMVWMIMNNLDFENAKKSLGLRSPFFEGSIIYDYEGVKEFEEYLEMKPGLKDSLAFIEKQPKPLCLKTHFPYECLPEQIQNNKKNPKIIYVFRNAKDTCVSYYHHSKLLEGFTGNFDEFCRLFLAGKVPFGSYWDHVLSYQKIANQPNILLLRFEDMKEDLPKIIKKVAIFLEKPLSEEQIQILTKHLSFESMKNNPAVNLERSLEMKRKLKLMDDQGNFMRSGTVGQYKEMMAPEIIQEFDRLEAEKAIKQ